MWFFLQWKVNPEKTSARERAEILWPLHQGGPGSPEWWCLQQGGTKFPSETLQRLLQQFQQEISTILHGLVYSTKFIWEIKNSTDFLSLCFPFSSSFYSAKHEPQYHFLSHERAWAGFQQLFRGKVDQYSKVKAIKITVQTGKILHDGFWSPVFQH